MGQGGELEPEDEEGAGYMEPPNFEFDHGRKSQYWYVHGAPLHNA